MAKNLSGQCTSKIYEKLCQIPEKLSNSERREISNDQIYKTLKSARDSLFHAGDKISFDMSSGGPKDHFPRFFWESEVFFKEGPFFATPNVYLRVPLKDAGSRIRNSGSIPKIDKISKTGRDHISQIIYLKCTTLNCQDSVEIKLGHATSTFLLNKKRGVRWRR